MSAAPPPIPPQVVQSVFALHYDDLFIGTAFGIAPLIAITTGHHIRLNQDDLGKLNLRKLNTASAAAAHHQRGDAEKENTVDPKSAKTTKAAGNRRGRAEDEAAAQTAEEKRKNIVAVASYANKETSSDVLVLWLDRKLPGFYPLRAHHPPEGTAVMMVSAATSPPHSDFVVSAGRVVKSPPPDSITTCCRATGLVSARGYSGSVVIEMPQHSDTVLFSRNNTVAERVTLPPRILGMHVSVYKNDNDPDSVNLIEFVSSYRILKMMQLYNVDPFSAYAQGTDPEVNSSSRTTKKRKSSFY